MQAASGWGSQRGSSDTLVKTTHPWVPDAHPLVKSAWVTVQWLCGGTCRSNREH